MSRAHQPVDVEPELLRSAGVHAEVAEIEGLDGQHHAVGGVHTTGVPVPDDTALDVAVAVLVAVVPVPPVPPVPLAELVAVVVDSPVVEPPLPVVSVPPQP